MKTTMKAKVIIETDKYLDFDEGVTKKANQPLTLMKIEEEINKGNYKLKWVNGLLINDSEPTIIISF